MSTPKFVVVTGGYEVSYAPRFDTRAEAEAWVSRVGEDGGWEERTEVLYEGNTAHMPCDNCAQQLVCDEIGEVWLCEACQPLAMVARVVGDVARLGDTANEVFMAVGEFVEQFDDEQLVRALSEWRDLNRAVYYLGFNLEREQQRRADL